MLAKLERTTFALCLLLLLLGPFVYAEEKLSADEIIRRHLDSIGSAAARGEAHSRVVEGTATYRALIGASSEFDGKAVLASDGGKEHVLLKINAPQYTGERFISDGEKTSVEGTLANKNRSDLGTLLRSEDIPLREGLLGGVLTTAWPLLHAEFHKWKLKSHGVKNVDGIDLYAVDFEPDKHTGFQITLYFEPETFRHIRTVYIATEMGALRGGVPTYIRPTKRTLSSPPTGGDVRAAREQPQRWEIEEQFSQFKTVDGLTLPSRYDLRFRQQSHQGQIKLIEWEVNTTRVLNNVPVDAHNFSIQ